MSLRQNFLPVSLVIAFGALCPAAFANTINGAVYCGLSSSDASNTTAPGSTPSSGTLCATFQSSDINFTNSNGGQNTIGQFLNSNGLIIGSVAYQNGYTSASNLDYSLLTFTGSAYFTNGQQYYATHDDGTVMQVNGITVINSPGPTSARTDYFVFSSASGMYNFSYNFSEVQGASIYKTNAAETPEPGTLPLASTGAAAFAVLRRRRWFRR